MRCFGCRVQLVYLHTISFGRPLAIVYRILLLYCIVLYCVVLLCTSTSQDESPSSMSNKLVLFVVLHAGLVWSRHYNRHMWK